MYRAPAALTLCTSSTARATPRNSRRARRHYRGTAKRRDHYRTLEIAYDATNEDVKGAFRRLAKESHPDLHPADASAVARFQRLVDAHSTLTDDSARRAYDAEIGNATSPLAKRPTSIRKSPTAPHAYPGGGSGVDGDTWNAWHYGDGDTVQRDPVIQTNRTRDGEKTTTTKWFERKIRSQEERNDAAAMNAVRQEKQNVVDRLKAKARARRAGRDLSAEQGGCVVS